MADEAAAVANRRKRRGPIAEPASRQRPKRQPPYHVILWNDDDHSYEYVITMLMGALWPSPRKGF